MATNLRYWTQRLELLKSIKQYGRRKPLTVFTRGIVCQGSGLQNMVKGLQADGLITKFKDSRVVKTDVTIKGEKVIDLLDQLMEVFL